MAAGKLLVAGQRVSNHFAGNCSSRAEFQRDQSQLAVAVEFGK